MQCIPNTRKVNRIRPATICAHCCMKFQVRKPLWHVLQESFSPFSFIRKHSMLVIWSGRIDYFSNLQKQSNDGKTL